LRSLCAQLDTPEDLAGHTLLYTTLASVVEVAPCLR
jgi:hypothetical protein